jgi:hypothetical protein
MVEGYFEGGTLAMFTLRTDQAVLEKVLRQTTTALNAKSAHHNICIYQSMPFVTENTA